MKSIACQQGEQAIARGVFGSPWIFVDGEPFLGQRSAVDGRAVARIPLVAVEKSGRAGDLQKELVALFESQNRSPTPGNTSIPATFLRVTVTA